MSQRTDSRRTFSAASRLLLLLLSGWLFGCGGDGVARLDLGVRFACALDREQAQTLLLRVRRGGCGQDGQTVYEATLRPGQSAPADGDKVGPGKHAFEGEAWLAGEVIAAGCVEAELPRKAPVQVLLGGRRSSCPSEGGVDMAGDAVDAGPGGSACEGDRCGSRCVDLQGDPAHCGDCDRRCPEGIACEEGDCACPEPLLHCGDACVDTTSNDDHCGECHDRCPIAGSICRESVCRCPANEVVCPSASLGEQCTSLLTDEANCGECGFACPPSATCVEGRCEDPSGCTYCTLPDGCFDRKTDELHCGACGRKCPAGTSCINGDCACNDAALTLCSPNEPLAERSCVDVKSDLENCGRCDSPCESTCNDRRCGACNVGETLCGGACVSLQSDAQSCGACDRSCPSGHVCSGGACKPADAGAQGCTAIHSNATGHDYLFCREAASWQDARRACRSLGADDTWDLVTLDAPNVAADELDLVAGEAMVIDPSGRWWLGARDDGDHCVPAALVCVIGASCYTDGKPTYYWVKPGDDDLSQGTRFCSGNGSCESLDGQLTHWASGEPNNSGCGASCICDPGEDCVELINGVWNDASCGTRLGFICESRF